MTLDQPSPAPLPPAVLTLDGEQPIVLRHMRAEDWTLELALSQTPDVPAWTFYPAAMTPDEARAWTNRAVRAVAEGRVARYAVITDTAGPVGMIGMGGIGRGAPTVFYALLPEGRGQGVATRAVHELTSWAHKNGHDEVHLVSRVGNTASEAVARRAGYTLLRQDTDERDGADITIWTSRALRRPPASRRRAR